MSFPFCNNGDVFLFLIFHMLLAHIVDYNVCKIYFVSFTNKENITIDTTPFREFDTKTNISILIINLIIHRR